MKLPRNFYKPLAIGAPEPLRELPIRLERVIQFVPGHNEKVLSKVPDLAKQVDVVLVNLEDAIPADAKDVARKGVISVGKSVDFGSTGFLAFVRSPDQISIELLQTGASLPPAEPWKSMPNTGVW